MPFGWFRVADSDELAAGEVRGVRYAGEELVVFRGYQGLTFTTPNGEIEGRVDIENHGGSFGITRFQGIVETLLVISGAPIDEGLYETTIHFSVRKPDGNADAARAVGAAFIAEVNRQIVEDIPIWENKVYLERPLLCDGDGPIGQVRSYFQQFYAPEPDPSIESPTSANRTAEQRDA
jgi:hypothetical protein